VKKILITGSNGLLGQKLVKLLKTKSEVEIYALSKGPDRLSNTKGYTYYNIDLTHFEAVQDCLNDIQPDVIIHTAAMTNVDACELEQEEL